MADATPQHTLLNATKTTKNIIKNFMDISDFVSTVLNTQRMLSVESLW